MEHIKHKRYSKLKALWLMKNEPTKRELKKQELKENLLQAARNRIKINGLSGLRARDITTDAGCSLGGLYTAYDDIDNLVLHVNSITLNALGSELKQIADQENRPVKRLIELARGYLKFACDNRNLWSALFDHRMPEGVDVPEWHLVEHAVLFEQIAMPLAELNPKLNREELATLSRSMFAAVHGIVSISLQDRFIAVPRKELDSQLTQFVEFLIKGFEASNT